MRVSVRHIARHRRIIEIVLARTNDEITPSESNLLRPAGNIVPCVAWLCHLIVPASRPDWRIAGYSRPARASRLVNRLIDLVNLERIAWRKIQISKQPAGKGDCVSCI
jgi:hypothetical protein